MSSKFLEGMNIIEILDNYFTNVVYEYYDGFEGFKRITCTSCQVGNSLFPGLKNEKPIFKFYFKSQKIDKNNKIFYTEEVQQNIFFTDLDKKTMSATIKSCFSVNDDDISKLLDLWYDFVLPSGKWNMQTFEFVTFPDEFIIALINKGFFNLSTYTIDELIKISDLVNNIDIIPKEAREIFIF